MNIRSKKISRRIVTAATASLALISVASCSSSGGTSSGSPTGSQSANTSGSTSAMGACGTIPTRLPKDPDGVLKAMPANIQANYNGYATPVQASPWSDWKSPAGGAVVGITVPAPVNDYAADTLRYLKDALGKMPGVKRVIVLAGAGPGDIPAQLQQYQSLVQQKVDLIIGGGSVGAAFVSAVDAAAKAGIPTVSPYGTIPTKNAINVVANNYLAAAQTAAAEMKAIKGSGSVLEIHGIPGISIDSDAFRGFADVLANCPKAKVVGTLTAGFVPAQAKTQVLKFLSTHPGSVDAVLQAGGMTTGAIEAFESTGRRIPIVNDIAAGKGSLGYWLKNRSTYTGTGSGGGASAYAELVSGIVQGLLNGDALKTSDVVQPQPIIDDANIGDWADPSWTLQTPGTAPDPKSSYDNAPIIQAAFAKPTS